MLHGRDYDENGYLFMVTRNGTVKRTEKSAFRNIRAAGLRGLTLDEGDELIAVLETDGEANVLIATHDGMAICFRETDVRPMGRTRWGSGASSSGQETMSSAGCWPSWDYPAGHYGKRLWQAHPH